MTTSGTNFMVDPKAFFDCFIETCHVKVTQIDVNFMDDKPLVLTMFLSLINTQGINAWSIYEDPEMKITFLNEIKKAISEELGDEAVADLQYTDDARWITGRKLAMVDPTRKLDRAIKAKIGTFMDVYIKFNDEKNAHGTPELAPQVTA